MAVVSEQTIWQDLLAEGASSIQAAGIMGNMQNESAFDPEAIGDQGTSFGLVQQHGAYSYLVTGNTQADLQRQLQNIKGDIGLASGSSASEAGSSFAANFEKCVGCEVGGSQNVQRSQNAQAIFNAAQTGNWPQQSTGAAAQTTASTKACIPFFGIPMCLPGVSSLIPGGSSVGSDLGSSLVSGIVSSISKMFGGAIKDILMRLGLILLGGIIIIIGIIVLARTSSNSSSGDMAEAIKQVIENENKAKATAGKTVVSESGATVAETAAVAALWI